MDTGKTESKKLTFASLATMALDELKGCVKTAVKLFEKIETARKGERDERKQNAKYVAELRCRYARGKDDGLIPGDVTFPKWAENIVGGKIPGRLQSLAALFNSLVVLKDTEGKSLITEEVYDAAALDWLEKANAIVNAAMKKDPEGWKTSEDVQECVKALSTPGDAAETLDKIRKRQKGVAEESTETEAVVLTAERAVEYLAAFYTTQLGVLQQKPEAKDAEQMFRRLVKINNVISAIAETQDQITDFFGQAYPHETLMDWAKLANAGAADHVQLIKEQPAPAAPAETAPAASAPETEAEETETPELAATE